MRARVRRLVHRLVRRARALARDGMRLSVLSLVAMAGFAHLGRPGLAAVVLGLAGIACARLSARRVPVRAQRPSGGRGGARVPLGVVRRVSPECLAGGADHGLCSGARCDCDCRHPGRTRTRSRRVLADDLPPF